MKEDVKDTKEKVDKMEIDIEALMGLREHPSKYKVFLTL